MAACVLIWNKIPLVYSGLGQETIVIMYGKLLHVPEHAVISPIRNISDTLGYASCVTFLFLPHFDVICDLLLNRRTATWNLFVNGAMGETMTTILLYFLHRVTSQYTS